MHDGISFAILAQSVRNIPKIIVMYFLPVNSHLKKVVLEDLYGEVRSGKQSIYIRKN